MKKCKSCGKFFELTTKINDITVRLYDGRDECLDCNPNISKSQKFYSNHGKKFKCKQCNKIYIYNTGGKNRTDLCATCVMKQYRNNNRNKAIRLHNSKCYICNYLEHPDILVFHHRNPKKKEFSIAQLSTKSWKKIVNEISKCVLLCPNCHALIHAGHIII